MLQIILTILLQLIPAQINGPRVEEKLESGWHFTTGAANGAEKPEFDDSKWLSVTIPHDWAIYGPFSREYDLQKVAVTQNGEDVATEKTGRTGGLPYVGIGWYRTAFDIPDFDASLKSATLLFDGAMSEAEVFVNGTKVCFQPYGYNSFSCNISDYVTPSGKGNLLAVRLENRPESSRWYPGAGLYRNVHLIVTGKTHIPVNGTCITTPHVEKTFATVHIATAVDNAPAVEIVPNKWHSEKTDENASRLGLRTKIIGPEGIVVVEKETGWQYPDGNPYEQNFVIDTPSLWCPEHPALYKAVQILSVDGEAVDSVVTLFGIRSVEVIAGKGFYLNGERRKFKGVCNHHDLGPLGAAVNEAAIRYRLSLLKDMGCDAIRTSHNMPSPELVRLCDEMGFMMMVEPFDEWDIAKCTNGYHRYFAEWAEKDMVTMIRNFRNNPSVVMWSIGNEVPSQCRPEGYKTAAFLQEICHREDPTRPVTCGMDQVTCVLENGFAGLLDVPGFNYRTHRYFEGYEKLPQGILLGSETSSTVSSRGVYKFPILPSTGALYDDHQCSSYDLEYCWWSNLPEEDFILADDYEWTMGQFVWTGFDYLGEPTPYDTDAWPNHSSLFGIIDLANLPKDRYYLYRSIWNTSSHTLHILPHWTWPGREGLETPVFVYTDYPEAELFVNEVSYGKLSKSKGTDADRDTLAHQRRYRLIWDNVIYEPGTLKVVAYDNVGNRADSVKIHTAGKPYRLEATAHRSSFSADGKDLVFITVRSLDKYGNLCPSDNRLVKFEVSGEGSFKAAANGDPCCLDLFHLPEMHLFNGMLTAIVQSGNAAGEIHFKAKSKIRPAEITFKVK